MYDIEMTVSPGADGSPAVVTFSGSMTVQHAGEIRGRLLEALAQEDALLLEVEAVQEIDLVGLQLMCAANREALTREKSFSVRGIQGGAVGQVAKLAGYPRHCACAHNTKKSCLWVGGENNG